MPDTGNNIIYILIYESNEKKKDKWKQTGQKRNRDIKR